MEVISGNVHRDVRKRWRSVLSSSSDGVLNDISVGIAGTFTTHSLIPYLGVGLVDVGYAHPSIVEADFDQILQVCHNWRSYFGPETNVIILVWRLEDLLKAKADEYDVGIQQSIGEELLSDIFSGLNELRRNFDGQILISAPPRPMKFAKQIRALGDISILDRLWHQSVFQLAQEAEKLSNVYVFDMELSISNIGAQSSFDDRKQLMFRQPYTEDLLHDLAKQIVRLVRAQTFEAKKCVVLDCDNTLWGGIVGEDGVEGIVLGEDFPGSGFLEFQKLCKILKQTGVFLCVCSKNNFEDAHEVFTSHSGMALGAEDIAVFKINWQLKSENIKQIAAELNIGTNSIVFIDDSDYEISEVKSALPEVTTIQVPDDVALFPRHFSSYFHLFDRLNITEDDVERTSRIVQDLERKSIQKDISHEDFLASLKLVVEYFEPRDDEINRVVQLINKTNQFNLMTVRHNLQEISKYREDKDFLVRCIKVADKFGEYGLVGVAIVKVDGCQADIRDFLMSCRVLGRGIETGFISLVARELEELGVKHIGAGYAGTKKNAQVKDLWKDHGFSPTERSIDGYIEQMGGHAWSSLVSSCPVFPEHLDVNFKI